MSKLHAQAHQAVEWWLEASASYDDPWRELRVEARVSTPDGRMFNVPAFWGGGQRWCVRYAGDVPGTHQLVVSSTPADPGLSGRRAELSVATQTGNNSLSRHGPLRVRPGAAQFEHADGTPFVWLGDTWWMLMSDRVAFPEAYARLVADRAAKGFNVVQVVVGFPPDVSAFDGRDGNEGGSPWEAGYRRINPRYFDFVDQRISLLCESGIVPCIVGSWGYHVRFMGEERLREHWRYLVARYAAYPVVWCIAGEGGMPYYLSSDRDADTAYQRGVWSRLAREIKGMDAHQRPLTLHPRTRSWDDLDDPSTLDFHMLQPGHMPVALALGVELVAEARLRFADKPVVNAEPPYEGHMGTNGADVQRYAFWSSMLSGAAGFTYGAAGVFQANDRERPTGERPDGGAFDSTYWDDAMSFPGGVQVAAGKRLLTELPFERLVPAPDALSAELRWGGEWYHPPFRVFAARAGVDCLIAYVPLRFYHWDGLAARGLAAGEGYTGFYFNPETSERHAIGEQRADSDGQLNLPRVPVLHDWVVVLQRANP